MKIDKDIPIFPKTGKSSKKAFVETLNKLEIGDSFVPSKKDAENLGQKLAYRGRQLGKKFSYRPDGNRIRVWCVK